MFRSVFAKYMTAFATIIFISFLLLSIIITATISLDSIHEHMDEIESVTDTFAEVLSDKFEQGSTANFQEFLKENATDIAYSLEIALASGRELNIFVSDVYGNILFPSDNTFTEKVPSHVLETVKKTNTFKEYSNLGGVLEQESDVYARAVIDTTHANNVVGILFACSFPDSLASLPDILYKTVFMSSLWVMLAALIAVYFISDRIIQPLKAMSNASKAFAKGNFDERVTVEGYDEIAELALAFNNMADSLARLEKMRNSFLANVSHDLRTPMTAIAGFIDGINSGAIPPEKHGYYLNIISSEIHRLSRLVTQILDISRLESGERKFTLAKTDICETARLVLISFEQKIYDKKLDVAFDCDEDSLFVLADKDAMHQVIYNLTENAIKFSKEKGELKITIQRVDKKQIQVIVYNEGIGMAKEELPFVFDRFYKTDKSRGLDKNGVGLGLYIVKTIVDAQNGTITVDSVMGEHCAFTLKFNEYEK